VKHDLRPIRLEHRPDALGEANVGDDGRDCGLRICDLRICDLQFAICSLPFAICDLQFAICSLPFAICRLQFAVCKRMICRHSSEPMEPPAPVTSTRLPRNMPLTGLTSVRTGSRRSRSSIRTSRTCLTLTLPSSSSHPRHGTRNSGACHHKMRCVTPSPCHPVTLSRRACPGHRRGNRPDPDPTGGFAAARARSLR